MRACRPVSEGVSVSGRVCCSRIQRAASRRRRGSAASGFRPNPLVAGDERRDPGQQAGSRLQERSRLRANPGRVLVNEVRSIVGSPICLPVWSDEGRATRPILHGAHWRAHRTAPAAINDRTGSDGAWKTEGSGRWRSTTPRQAKQVREERWTDASDGQLLHSRAEKNRTHAYAFALACPHAHKHTHTHRAVQPRRPTDRATPLPNVIYTSLSHTLPQTRWSVKQIRGKIQAQALHHARIGLLTIDHLQL